MKNVRILIVLAVGAVIGVLFAFYVTKKPVTPEKKVAALEKTAGAPEKKLSKVLNIYNWEDYFGETTLADFEKQFGVKVNLDTFEDEEELLATVRSHPDKYDILITSDDNIRECIEMKTLVEIDLRNIPNMKNIDPKFRKPHYDPGHKHSVPYL